jgi:pyridoxal phosphate enzyme (YggS family)
MAAAAEVLERLQRNLHALEGRIASACDRAGRQRGDVQLVAVTKYVDAEIAAALHQCGLLDLGESRPQALWEKSVRVPTARWHLVGHLQRNKVARTVPLTWLIHSIDSQRLLEAVEEEAGRTGKVQDVLLEFHLSGEAAKHGFPPEDWPRIADQAGRLRNVRIKGLMCMAALDSTPEEARATFGKLRTLRDAWRPGLSAPHDLAHLSMGMTNDYPEAIAEGATMIRIGSALFEGLSVAAT